MQATDGGVYGTTAYGGTGKCSTGCGTIFEVAPHPDGITRLYSFETSDAYVVGGLLQATSGTFYGTTAGINGISVGYGTVYSFSTGLGPFVSFVLGSGSIGQTAQILGQGLTGTTSVSLNGIPASFTVESDTFIKATVPVGATSGYVTVTTPTGVLTSNVPFYVLP
jgi:uncharacterized repeat protein (TIGR03803 family)